MTVQGRGHSFLVDSGARYSTISWNVLPELISSDTVELVGFSGRQERLPLSVPLLTCLAGQTVLHPFVISPHCPINLLGRDLLVRTGAAILCGDQGLVVQFPNGMELLYSTQRCERTNVDECNTYSRTGSVGRHLLGRTRAGDLAWCRCCGIVSELEALVINAESFCSSC